MRLLQELNPQEQNRGHFVGLFDARITPWDQTICGMLMVMIY